MSIYIYIYMSIYIYIYIYDVFAASPRMYNPRH